MKKFLFYILLFKVAFASLQDIVETKITAVNPSNQTIEFESKDLKVGETGWIYANVTDYGGILSLAEIVKINQNKAIAKIKQYDALKQIYLPNPTLKPKIGDKVIFRKLNKHAFLIAPTLELYDQIKTSHQEVEFLSSDLLLGYLYAYGGYDPTKEFLRSACNIYAAGLIYVVAQNELAILDCQSIKILSSEKLDTSSAKEPIIPFYSRIEPVKTGTLFSIFANKKSKYYFSYFTSLVHPEISYQVLLQKERPLVEAREQARKKQLEEEKKKNKAKKQEKKHSKDDLKTSSDQEPSLK